MSTKKKLLTLLLLSTVLLASSGCGNSPKTEDNAAQGSSEPVTLTMVTVGSGIEDEEFNNIIADPVKAKYPNITVQLHRYEDGESLESMVAAQQFPDLVFAGILDVSRLKQLDLVADLNPLITKNKMDLSKFDPSTIEMVKKYGDNGQIYAMPFSLGFPITFYDKDIFDKFAVPYPKDGMTWDDTIALARKITREDAGTQYKGFAATPFPRLSLSMLQPKYDFKQQKAVLTTDGWKRAVETFKEFKTIPGNDVPNGFGDFAKNKVLAMFATFNGSLSDLEAMEKQGKGFNWDMVTFPTYPEKPLVVDTPLQILMATSTSKHLDDVYKVLDVVTSKENQINMSKNARPPVLTDADVQKAFGQNYASLKGKNVAAAFKYKHEAVNISSPYDSIIDKAIAAAGQAVLKGSDVNTALREAEESANKEIESQK